MICPLSLYPLYRERALGPSAIGDIFSEMRHAIADFDPTAHTAREVEEEAPFLGEIYMGHLRYSTTGRSGMSYVHPFLRRNNWRSRNLMLCGNFNMTNVDNLFEAIVSRGQHPRIYSDTIMLLEQLGYALDSEHSRLYHELRSTLEEPELTRAIESQLDIERVLHSEAPGWDGGFVMCGCTGSGDMFALRDRHGIRPAFYFADDEVIAVASERPVLSTAFNIPTDHIRELAPGSALISDSRGRYRVCSILEPGRNARCSFERVYFSRGSDVMIELVFVGAYKILVNLIPHKTNGVPNDGYIVKMLDAHIAMRKDYALYLRIYADTFLNKAISPSDYQYERNESLSDDELLYYNEIQEILKSINAQMSKHEIDHCKGIVI